jgi:broad specificity phosphatase PhoE
VAPEGGETIADVHGRALPAVRAIVAAHPGETVAVVAHGAVNKAILLSVLGSPLESYGRMAQDNAAINVLEWRAGTPRVVALNETGHLDGLQEAATRPEVLRQTGRPRADSAETPAAPPAYTPRRQPE